MKEIINDTCIVLTEKKSKFITRLHKITSVKQVDEFLKEIRAAEKGATHNCYAWRLAEKQSIAEGRSDDGEPSGTAGQPMLSVLSGEDAVNVLAVVTRYFGGIKLGTGGLVRIYGKCVKEALKDSGMRSFIVRENFEYSFHISKTSYIQYILDKLSLFSTKRDFSDPIYPVYHFLFSENEKTDFLNEVNKIN
ncbi:MAG: YigZ family protein [Spirochaetales bacterium]|nr:YigZ family protein [Spirochaetales bacterium]